MQAKKKKDENKSRKQGYRKTETRTLDRYGLGNQVTMLPKFHTVNIPRLGHSSLEFTFAIYAYALNGLWWVVEIVGQLAKRMVRLIRER